jgi:hypothetical protein
MSRHEEALPRTEVTITREVMGAHVVELKIDGYSSGFFVVDEPQDLCLLRDKLDEYINANGIRPEGGQ